ncbi:hypothetical protein BIV60_22825 [Bacillus sp. MUM 116]|uniref:hypothetical protein n=1 Tax=Bacillus sp. MUM 116 TaxID=1678002 RepID=UPI0008F5DE79|nr:hypothetical protein [Bacillus sp. MUM 116]OIK09806.1 hypothetical protein BIV60_22825 [Bacillus sp. MUM 116]
MNRVGKYACGNTVDETELLKMVLELPEKDKMLMWSEGYIDHVIEKLPKYGQDILVNRTEKWEDTKVYYRDQLEDILSKEEVKVKMKSERKEFALFVMNNYRELQSLLFLSFDRNLKDIDLRKFVYRRRYGGHRSYLK